VRIIMARYPGKCPRCGCPISPGDPIVRAGGRWIHADCGRFEPTEFESEGEYYARCPQCGRKALRVVEDGPFYTAHCEVCGHWEGD